MICGKTITKTVNFVAFNENNREQEGKNE